MCACECVRTSQQLFAARSPQLFRTMTCLLRSLLFAWTLLFAATWANALVPVQSGYRVDGIPGGPFSSEAAACANALSVVKASNPTYTYRDAGINAYHQCDFWYKNSPTATEQNAVYNITATPAACPANSTAVTGGCQCNANYDESGGQCVPHTNQCAAKTGQTGLLNWTEGYTRTPDEGDRQAVGPIMTPPASGEVCDAGCAVSLQTSGPGVQPYVSQAPTANGLYRRSIDYPSLALGKECTMGAADAGAKKDAPPPECPGSVGDLGDGKPVCVGTAAKPVVPTPLGAAPAQAAAGNPAAGAKPASGEGSGTGSTGRTPSTGNGTASGGPAAAGTGGKGGGAGGTAGTGAGKTGDQPDPCGAPGQPVCNVKVDEKGTPANAGTTFDAAKKSVDDSGNDTLQKINQARDRSDGPAWSFTFALPTGCAPYPIAIAGVVLNMCEHQGTIHDLLSMVWAAVTVFTIIGMVGRTIRGT